MSSCRSAFPRLADMAGVLIATLAVAIIIAAAIAASEPPIDYGDDEE